MKSICIKFPEAGFILAGVFFEDLNQEVVTFPLRPVTFPGLPLSTIMLEVAILVKPLD